MKSLKECCGCPCGNFATPINTLGMGGIEPCNTDPIPQKKKRKMKSLKDRIRKLVKDRVKEKDYNSEY